MWIVLAGTNEPQSPERNMPPKLTRACPKGLTLSPCNEAARQRRPWSLDVFANESQRDSASKPQVARGNSEAPRATWGCRTPCSSTSKRLRPLVDPVGLTYPFQLCCILNPKCTARPIRSGVCARAPAIHPENSFFCGVPLAAKYTL